MEQKSLLKEVLLVDKINQQLNLTDQLSDTIDDIRDQNMLKHSIQDMLKQRVYGITAGYEDLNDHNQLRKDILLKLLSKKDNDLASASTLCRLEQMSTPTIKDQDILVTAFINSYEEPPKSICLDFDPTDVVLYEDQDVVLYEDQEFKKYHRYYRDYCYLPLIVSYLW